MGNCKPTHFIFSRLVRGGNGRCLSCKIFKLDTFLGRRHIVNVTYAHSNIWKPSFHLSHWWGDLYLVGWRPENKLTDEIRACGVQRIWGPFNVRSLQKLSALWSVQDCSVKSIKIRKKTSVRNSHFFHYVYFQVGEGGEAGPGAASRGQTDPFEERAKPGSQLVLVDWPHLSKRFQGLAYARLEQKQLCTTLFLGRRGPMRSHLYFFQASRDRCQSHAA